jgi:hypothetical protein
MADERLQQEYHNEIYSGEIRAIQFDDISMPLLERGQLREYFREAKNFPQLLGTQNSRFMQQVFLSVPQHVWTQRVANLELALQSSRQGDTARRNIVTRPPTLGISLLAQDQLNNAFLEKYEELLHRVKLDVHDYFPYHIKSTSAKVMLFEKMSDLELVRYVLQRF